MRVISGSAGGVPLKAPSRDFRPTMDVVREAVFSALGNLVVGARVLDLFAGSGAYGIEALSRGASEVVFVDNHLKSIETIRLNLGKTRLEGKLIKEDVFRYLLRVGQPFRLIFADPPYAKCAGDRNYALELLQFKPLNTALEPQGLLVLERAPEKNSVIPGTWEVTRSKKYGRTEVIFCIPKS